MADHTEISGTVRFNGAPLTGGRITFKAGEGDPGSSAVIDPNGRYKISAPVGDVNISIDNSMLNPAAHKGKERIQKGAGPRPGGFDPEEVKGAYVPIPQKYADPKTSGLTYTVKKGDKEHDIDLTDK